MTEKLTKRPTAIDLFCGCGGLSKGLEMAGLNPILLVEKGEIIQERISRKNFS